MTERVVVVGAGHAGVQACAALRDDGFTGQISLVSAEQDLPYHRPPLSKTVLRDPAATPQPLRSRNFFASKEIELLLGTSVSTIDLARRTVDLDRGGRLSFDYLVLALGSVNRRVELPGLKRSHELRTFSDACALRGALSSTSRLVIVGGGFIGMEVAAALVGSVASITLLEAAPRLLSRTSTEIVSGYLHGQQLVQGITIATATSATGVGGRDSTAAIVDTDGRLHPADEVLVSVGAIANADVAQEAGLEIASSGGYGILVDSSLETSHPGVFAIGDCATFPWRGELHRLESVQTAVDQARHVSRRIAHQATTPYDQVPWFWSQQGKDKLQIAGLVDAAADCYVRGDIESGSFSVLGYAGDELVFVESMNAPRDHLGARRLLEASASPDPDRAIDPRHGLSDLVPQLS